MSESKAPSTATEAGNSSSPTTAASEDRLSADELEALRNRNPEAVRRHVYENQDFIRSVLHRYTEDEETARDLVQETFFQALRSLPSFRGESKLSTWLYSIARNVALARYRKSKRHSYHEEETLSHLAETADGPATGNSPANWNPVTETVHGEKRSLVYEALEDLSENYREIIRMRDLEELSTKEVAQELGLSRVNVRVRLHRARKKLQDALEGRVEGDYRVA